MNRPRMRTVALGVGIVLGTLSCVQAQALDLLGSYEAALAEDAEYRAAQAQARAHREVVPIALSQLYPSVSGNYDRFENDLTSETSAGTTESRYPSTTFALTLRQPLYRPSQYAAYQQSKAQLTGVEATLAKSEQDMAVRVASAYFNALLAEEVLRVVLSQQQAISTQLDAATMALRAGQGTRTDIDDARARLDSNKAQEISVRQQIEQTRQELAILVNQPVTQLSPLDASRLELRPPDPEDLEAWLLRAEALSPDLVFLRSEVESNRIGIDKARAARRLTVDLVAQTSINESDNVTNPDARYDNDRVGIQLSLPIYSGGYVSAQVRSSQAALTESEERLEAARRKLLTEVRKQYQAVTSGISKIRALEQAERSGDQAVLSSQKGFQAGTRTRLDILDAEQRRSQIRLELARERINYVLAHVQLQALCGEVDRTRVAAVNGWLSSGP